MLEQLSTWKKVVPSQPPPLVAGGSKWVIIQMADASGIKRKSLLLGLLELRHSEEWESLSGC
jgi:hypothetical protein